MCFCPQLIADAVTSTQLASYPWSHLSQMQAQIFLTVHIHFPSVCILVGKTQLALSTFSRTANKNCHILQVGYLLSGLLSLCVAFIRRAPFWVRFLAHPIKRCLCCQRYRPILSVVSSYNWPTGLNHPAHNWVQTNSTRHNNGKVSTK